MKTKTFEEWLQNYFVEKGDLNGVPIIKDNCEDLFEGWLSNQDVNDIIEMAEVWGKELIKSTDTFKYDAQLSNIISSLERIEEAVVPPTPDELR